jgi:hypothetical protein
MVGGLTRKQAQAAARVAEDQQTDAQIAAAVGVSAVTLWKWKQRPDFAARVEEHKARWAAEIEQEGIANRQNRINALNDRWSLMQQVITARAADATMTGAGHETGLLVRTYKPGKYRVVEEYRFDAALLAELRAHELQAARELGQLVEKRELTGKNGGPVEVEHGGAIEVRAVDYRMTTATLHPLPAALGGGGEEEGAA